MASSVLALAGLPLFAAPAAEGAAGDRTTLTVELFDRGNMDINEPKIYPLQMKLSFLVLNASSRAIMEQERGQGIAEFVAEEGIKTATIMVATVPILLVYPWLQRYFTAA